MKYKVYIYQDKETACRVARTASHNFDMPHVEQKGSALKMDSRIYDELARKTYMPKAEWVTVEEK
jgi:hypothetical protein